MLTQNLIVKCDQLITYASRLLNNIELNYTMAQKETLTMVYAFHKFHHYLLGNKFIFYVDHMVLLYLVRKPQVSRKNNKVVISLLGVWFFNNFLTKEIIIINIYFQIKNNELIIAIRE
jgi:hypothetical protein